MTPDSTNFYGKAPPDRGASSFVYPPTPANIAFFAEALANGALVAIPTETVYGLAGLALEQRACRDIFSIKGRPLVDPLIVHVADMAMAAQLAHLPSILEQVAEAFWPGPLTVILRKRPIVPDIVTAGKDTVAIRMPRHPVAQELLKRLQAPLAAPSANPFGYVSPSLPGHVAESFGDKVPYILDGGPCEIGLESTILDLTNPELPRILRPGAVSEEDISRILGVPVLAKRTVEAVDQAATAPGTFERHYSPRATLTLFEQGTSPEPVKGQAVVYLKRPTEASTGTETFWLSENGNMEEVARSLFALLRQLDKAGYSRLQFELPEDTAVGLNRAIRDRLNRAAADK